MITFPTQLQTKDLVVLITGVNGGIGRALADTFAAAGARLILAARNEDALDDLCADYQAAGYPKPLTLAYDMREHASVTAAMQRVAREAKRVDVLINNAGVMIDAPLGMISQAAMDETLQVNVAAALTHMQYAAKLMTRQGSGCIINIASLLGIVGNANQTLYAASKAALIGATKSAAKELAPKKIRVNAIAPGFIDTAMTAGYSPAVRDKTLASIGLGRAGTPQDVANAALFLASDLASYITGQVIGVDGGLVI